MVEYQISNEKRAVSCAVPDERAALVALYNATDGTNWVFNTNWLSDKPMGEWYGVTTGTTGRVTHLRLFTYDSNKAHRQYRYGLRQWIGGSPAGGTRQAHQPGTAASPE